jgi:hypothetical protein
MSGVRKSERGESRLEAQHVAYKIRKLIVKELLCAPEDEERAAAAAAALCGREAEIRMPAGKENGTPFAAVRWLYGTAPSRWKCKPEGWFGPGLD